MKKEYLNNMYQGILSSGAFVQEGVFFMRPVRNIMSAKLPDFIR